jgi:hypothetical protein
VRSARDLAQDSLDEAFQNGYTSACREMQESYDRAVDRCNRHMERARWIERRAFLVSCASFILGAAFVIGIWVLLVEITY